MLIQPDSLAGSYVLELGTFEQHHRHARTPHRPRCQHTDSHGYLAPCRDDPSRSIAREDGIGQYRRAASAALTAGNEQNPAGDGFTKLRMMPINQSTARRVQTTEESDRCVQHQRRRLRLTVDKCFAQRAAHDVPHTGSVSTWVTRPSTADATQSCSVPKRTGMPILAGA